MSDFCYDAVFACCDSVSHRRLGQAVRHRYIGYLHTLQSVRIRLGKGRRKGLLDVFMMLFYFYGLEFLLVLILDLELVTEPFCVLVLYHKWIHSAG